MNNSFDNLINKKVDKEHTLGENGFTILLSLYEIIFYWLEVIHEVFGLNW